MLIEIHPDLSQELLDAAYAIVTFSFRRARPQSLSTWYRIIMLHAVYIHVDFQCQSLERQFHVCSLPEWTSHVSNPTLIPKNHTWQILITKVAIPWTDALGTSHDSKIEPESVT